MPCYQPFRDDSAQLLLFKIASCLEASGGGGVLSFNGRIGDVILTLADVSAVADDIYVNESGDSMTGSLAMLDGTAPLPALTFSSDTDTGIFNPAANAFAISTTGVERLRVTATGVGIGTTPTQALEIWSATALLFNRYTASDTQGAFLSLGKSNSATIGTSTLNPNADAQIAKINFNAANGVGFTLVAGINVLTGSGGHPNSGDMPSYMTFTTVGDGTASTAERMRISDNGFVGIATATPNSVLQIGGSFSLPYVSKIAAYTVGGLDYFIDCTANTFTVDLPTAVGITGRIYVLKNSGAGVITIDPSGAETIDGAATQAVVAGASFTIASTGANWIIV